MMQNKSGSRTKRLIGRILNVRSWVDFDRIRAGLRYITGVSATYFVPGKTKKTESFDEAVARLKLSEAALLARKKGLFRLSLCMVGAAMLVLGYAVYNLYYEYFTAAFLSLIVMCLALVLAFRYHFWYFQIKHHQLGCSLSEWFHQGLMGHRDE